MEQPRLSRKRPLTETNTLPEINDGKRHETEIDAAGILYTLGQANAANIVIPRDRTVKVGRSRSCDVRVSPLDCSTKHCEIGVSNVNGQEIIYLKDLSSNGTFVNGTLVGKGNTCLVRNGDKVSFASSCHYILRYRSAGNTAVSFFDSYILTETLLGTGHYAQVKEAIRRKTGEVCAVKIFNPAKHSVGKSGNEEAAKLNRELDILTKLNHPNIVGFYDAFLEPIDQTTVTTYLVLEKVNGGELFNRIVNKGKLSQPETKAIITQLLTGLKYLHSMDIVHRDLKPENILLEIQDGDQQYPWDTNESVVTVKIADFGLAKFIGKLSFTNTLCGTPAYVAPEVLVNQTVRRYNKAVDMWSIGVLLYVCLCGFPPFSEELGPPSMRQQIIEARFAFYSPYWDEIDDSALDLISRLLVADPNRRLNVDQAIQHPWLQKEPLAAVSEAPAQSIPAYDEMADIRAHQLSIRIPATSRGYSNEPITLQKRVQTGLDDDSIVKTFCTFEKK